MNAMPNGWTDVTFGDVFDRLQYGLTAKANGSAVGIRFLRITDIEAGKIDWRSVPGLISDNDTERYRLAHGDFVFARSGSIEKAARIETPPDAVFASYLIRGKLLCAEASDWIKHFIVSHRYLSQINERAAGIGMSNVNAVKLASVTFPLPPLPEQRRIVAKIDSLSAKSRLARDHLDHIPRLVEKYKQAILAAAFRGDLTAVSGSNTYPDWTKSSLADVCDPRRPITYGVIKLGSETPDGVPCLRTSNVRWLRIDTDGMKRIAPALSSEYARTILRGGEVLVNVRGTLGGVAVAEPSMAGWNVSREVAVAPVDTAAVDPDYAAYWIGADTSQRWLNRVEKGVAYTGINIEDLRKLPIEFPSVDRQREIVRRIETAFAWVDRLASETASARKLVDHLDQAVLAKAFRGELVPQDPNDEPASVLLERIRAERSSAPTATRKRRQSA